MHREPPPSLVTDLAAYRAEREQMDAAERTRRLWLAGRRMTDHKEWVLYERRHRLAERPLLHDYDGDAA